MTLDDLLDNAQDFLRHGDFETAAEFIRAYDESVAASGHAPADLDAEANYISRRIREARPELARV